MSEAGPRGADGADEAVRLGQQHFRRMADAMPQILWTADASGTVDYVNRAFLEFVGGSLGNDPLQSWLNAVHPDDLSRCISYWQTTAATGDPYELQFRLRRHDGAYRWHQVNASASRGPDGGILLWFGTAIDIEARQVAEAAVAQTAQRLTATLESMVDGVVTLDRDWRFTFINPAAERLVRQDRTGLMGQSMWEAFPGLRGSAFETNYRRAVDERTPVHFEAHFAPLGAWFRVSAIPYADGLVVHFLDITRRHRMIEDLAASEGRFRAVARATADVIWDWDLRDDTVWWSDGFQTTFGYQPDEIGATSLSWTDRIHPEDRDRVVHGIHAVIDQRGEYWEDEYRFLHQDGRVRTVSDRGFLILDAAGQPIRFVGGMRDTTEKREALQRLEQQAALLDEAQDAIMVRDLDNRVTFWNRGAERIYGWSREEAMGGAVEDMLYAEPTEFRAATAKVIADGRWIGRLVQKRRDGSKLTVAARWSLVRDRHGKPHSILASNTDITERLALEDQLRQSQRLEAVGQLTGGIAHDFNNLLTVILGNAELLLEGLAGQPDLLPLAQLTSQAARRGAELTHRLLAFSRRQALAPRPVAANPLIEEMMPLLRRALPATIDIRLALAPVLPECLADPGQLEAALLNLALNARDAMPDGGRLTIETAPAALDTEEAAEQAGVEAGRYTMLAVSDTGTGMPRDVIDRVFDPFFTTKEKGKGTGLGLSMVYGFVKQSGGHIRIYSELGHGTTVKIYMPCALHTARATATAPIDAGPGQSGGETILMVEDDPLVREHVEAQLRQMGYRVISVGDPVSALEMVRTRPDIELLFTDVIMPGGMNGRELAEAANSIRPELKVLYTSGYAENAIVHHGRLDPGVHLLSKPYQRADLKRMVHRVLNGSEPS